MFLPEVSTDGQDILKAFWELNTDRQFGMSVGPIPFSAIDAYARRHGVDDPDEFALWVRMIRLCDRVFIEHMTKDKPT